MRFRQLQIGGGERIYQAACRRAVASAGEHPVEVQQVLAKLLRFGGQQGRERGLEFVVFPLCREQADDGLACLNRIRLDLVPEPGGFQGSFHAAAVEGLLGGPAGDARVARFPGKFEVQVGRTGQLSALPGDFGQQELVEQFGGQLDIGQAWIRGFRFGGRFLGG